MIEAAERAGLLRPGGTIIEPTSRQHRPRPGDRGGAEGLPLHLRDGRQAVGREAGAPPGLRRRGRPLPDERPAGVARRATTRSRRASPATSPAPSSRTSTGTWRTRAAHEPTTGPEIWEQTDGPDHPPRGQRRDRRHDHRRGPLPARRRTRDLVVVGADPEGSVLSGDVARPYLTEGVGEDFFPGTYDPARRSTAGSASRDRDAFAMARRITREEGILAGESCGTAMVAALDECARADRPSRRRRRTRSSSCILPDSGRNYLSKLYNDEWMRANGLLPTPGGVVRVCASSSPTATTASSCPTSWSSGRPRPVGRGDRAAPGASGSARCPSREDRDGERARRPRRLGQREGAPGSRLPRPRDRRAHGRRGHGPAAAPGPRDARRSTRRSRCSPAARRRSSRPAASGRPASSRSSTSSST